MNNTPPTPGAPQGGASQNAPFGAGFFDWIRGLGMHRGHDRWFAGVAGGIAQRAGIDPIIVRGIFIVLAVLGGPGLALYLAGWLLMPDADGRIHLEELFRGRASTSTIVATVAVGVFVVLPFIFGIGGISVAGGWGVWNAFGFPGWLSTTVSVLVWIALLAAAAFVLSRMFLKHGRKVRDAEQTAAQAGEPAAGQAPAGDAASAPYAAPGTTYAGPPASYSAASADTPTVPYTAPTAFAAAPGQEPSTDARPDWTQRITDTAERASERAAKWGEDVGKQADDWSARYAAQHDQLKLGAGHVVITLALALLAAGGAAFAAWDMGLGTPNVLTAALLGGTAVVAVSLIVAGIRGRRTGWIGFLAACGVIALLFTSVLPSGSRFQPFGVLEVEPGAPAAVLVAGTTDIDLTALDGTDGTENLEVWHLTGKSVVTLPAEVPVKLTVRLLAGSIDASEVSDASSLTAGPFLSRTIDTREDVAEAATNVTVYMVAGSVRIEEAPAAVRGERSREQAPAAADSDRRAELRSELSELRAEEDSLRAELGEKGLSDVRTERLENTLEFTRDEIQQLVKELAE